MKERFGQLDPSLNRDLDDIEQNYVNLGGTFLVAEDNGNVIATLGIIYPDKATARIVRVSVLASHRRKGIARALLQSAEELIHQRGIPRILAYTEPHWIEAIALYQSIGYKQIGQDEIDIHLMKEISKAEFIGSPSTNTIKAVIFDLDETLLDRRETLRIELHRQYREFDLSSSFPSAEDYISNYLKAEQNGYKPRKEAFHQVLGGKHPSIDALIDDLTDSIGHNSVFKTGAEKLLKRMEEIGIKLGLITNGSSRTQRRKLHSLGIEGSFGSILISEEVGIKKPDSEIFEKSLRELDVEAHEAVFIGDHPIVDVEGAAKCGLQAFWLRNEVYEPPKCPHTPLNSLGEMLEYLFDRVIDL